MRRRLATVALLLLASSMLTVAKGNLINVAWTSGVNYTEWASDKQFLVGDWIKFVFNKYQYSVLEVNGSNYKNCIETDFITNITRGGRDVFQLNKARPYYFISGFGQCYGGVKLAIDVESAARPQPAPPKNASPRNVNHLSWLVMFLCWAVMYNANGITI